MTWKSGTTTSSRDSTSAGARNSAIVARRPRRGRLRTAGRAACPARGSRMRAALSPGLGGIRDLVGDVLRRRLAGEQRLDGVVDGLTHGRSVCLVEIELHERRLAARVEHLLHVRVRDRALGALGDREDRAGRAGLVGDLRADQELHEVDGLRRRLRADREPVAAAELLALLAGAALDLREREPAEVVTEALLVLGVGVELVRRPLAHQVHGRALLGHRPGLAARARPWRGQEALLERLHVDQLLELFTGLDEAGGVEGAVLARLGHRVLAGDAQREVRPPEHAGPLVLLADRDRGDAGGLELLDVGEELAPGRLGCVDAGLLEERL